MDAAHRAVRFAEWRAVERGGAWARQTHEPPSLPPTLPPTLFPSGLKKFYPKPLMKLLGFKPLSALQAHHNMRSPYFLFPDEDAMACCDITSRVSDWSHRIATLPCLSLVPSPPRIHRNRCL